MYKSEYTGIQIVGSEIYPKYNVNPIVKKNNNTPIIAVGIV